MSYSDSIELKERTGLAELTLVRHGQASFGAANYDQLSDLGMQQSRWLGEYFAAIGAETHTP